MITKEDKDTKGQWAVVRVILALVLGAFICYGLFIKPKFVDDPFVTDNLWDALHPMSIINVIGVILFFHFVFLLSGLYEKLLGQVFTNAPRGVLTAMWVSGVAGVILIWV